MSCNIGINHILLIRYKISYIFKFSMQLVVSWFSTQSFTKSNSENNRYQWTKKKSPYRFFFFVFAGWFGHCPEYTKLKKKDQTQGCVQSKVLDRISKCATEKENWFLDSLFCFTAFCFAQAKYRQKNVEEVMSRKNSRLKIKQTSRSTPFWRF